MMNTKAICITVLVSTILIFAANHYAARSAFQSEAECSQCDCTVKLVSVMGTPKEKEPSCSVSFTTSGKAFDFRATSYMEKVGIAVPVSSCAFSVFCDRTHLAKVVCAGTDAQEGINPSQKGSFRCRDDGRLDWTCDHWQRQQQKTEKKTQPQTKKKKSHAFGPMSATSSMFLASTNISASMMSGFLPAKYIAEATDDQEAKEIINGSTRWWLFQGEAGIEQGVFMVATGEAEAQSFCTGDTISLVGPNVFSLPTCQVDASGSWHGVYGRRLAGGKVTTVAVRLELRKESGLLRGELKTPDGTFNIVSWGQNISGFNLQAEGTVAGKLRKIALNGELRKGNMVFDGREDSGSPDTTYRLTGALTRLYIADGALLPAVINQPYSFPLTALAPEDQAVTFRVTGGPLPRGISLDASSGTLSGTPTELGNFKINVVASDADGDVFEQPLTLIVKKIFITTRLLPDASFGQAYSVTLQVAGGQPPYRFSGVPPRGLTLDPNTGVISGTPTTTRSNTSYLMVRDSQNNSDAENVSLTVRGTTILTSHFLPDATKGSPYRTQFQVVGNNLPTQWSISGGADINSIGLKLNPQTGELSGTPTRPGVLLLSVLAKTTSVDAQSRNFALTIK
jgi:Putative Ig domain